MNEEEIREAASMGIRLLESTMEKLNESRFPALVAFFTRRLVDSLMSQGFDRSEALHIAVKLVSNATSGSR
jgi:hypothetical protein